MGLCQECIRETFLSCLPFYISLFLLCAEDSVSPACMAYSKSCLEIQGGFRALQVLQILFSPPQLLNPVQ